MRGHEWCILRRHGVRKDRRRRAGEVVSYKLHGRWWSKARNPSVKQGGNCFGTVEARSHLVDQDRRRTDVRGIFGEQCSEALCEFSQQRQSFPFDLLQFGHEVGQCVAIIGLLQGARTFERFLERGELLRTEVLLFLPQFTEGKKKSDEKNNTTAKRNDTGSSAHC
jgi:hypothetical protein